MFEPNGYRRLICVVVAVAAVILLAGVVAAQAQNGLFRQQPVPTAPSRHGRLAHIGDLNEGILSIGPEQITIEVPGNADLRVHRVGMDRRGPKNMVWRGQLQSDGRSNVTLTFHEGFLFGHIQYGNDVYIIRPQGGRTVVEMVDTDSFAPEWGHDAATQGHDMVPPVSGGDTIQNSTAAAAPAAAADGTVQIVLMSVYTPQARAAAGGTTQIQARIQAAVDQANTAFINSNMIARYFLAHTEEVSYNDSGDIVADLDWVTSDATVASLRNTYAADMVSLIVANGGRYCGVGWVQRNPGAGFANYAFQASDIDCLSNHTLAHEHGHNLGFEHDPANAGTGPSGASYPWSFGHYVNGAFRTIMSYDACTVTCPRVLHFSNPDVLYNGVPTGIVDQRDNAQTGDLTAAIVAAFRAGGGSAANNPPVFAGDPIIKPDAIQGLSYSGSLSGDASDPDADPLTFAKFGGPAWLSVAAGGGLSGTPGASDIGLNSFTVGVSDGHGGSVSATLQVNVISNSTMSAPTDLTATAAGSKRIDLTWSDNSTEEVGFRIERSTNGVSFSKIALVGAGVTRFSNTRLRKGKTYYYRVRAYAGTTNSAYSNTASATAN
jgi:peptidyl-Asp metalloendopeptidase